MAAQVRGRSFRARRVSGHGQTRYAGRECVGEKGLCFLFAGVVCKDYLCHVCCVAGDVCYVCYKGCFCHVCCVAGRYLCHRCSVVVIVCVMCVVLLGVFMSRVLCCIWCFRDDVTGSVCTMCVAGSACVACDVLQGVCCVPESVCVACVVLQGVLVLRCLW